MLIKQKGGGRGYGCGLGELPIYVCRALANVHTSVLTCNAFWQKMPSFGKKVLFCTKNAFLVLTLTLLTTMATLCTKNAFLILTLTLLGKMALLCTKNAFLVLNLTLFGQNGPFVY